jgi:hypothetical protein
MSETSCDAPSIPIANATNVNTILKRTFAEEGRSLRLRPTDVAGARYSSGMKSGRLLPKVPNEKKGRATFCWSHPRLCSAMYCSEVLKDQKSDVELDLFNETWQKGTIILDQKRRTKRSTEKTDCEGAACFA